MRGLLRPLLKADQKKIRLLIAQLEDQRFLVRSRASRELRALEDLAEPALRQALAAQSSPEQRQRLQALLARLEPPDYSPRQARLQRSVEVLERAGTEEACCILQEISTQAPGRWLRQRAKGSLERLERMRVAKRVSR